MKQEVKIKILSILLQGDSYGLEIQNILNNSRSNLIIGSSIYPKLRQLERDGYIRSREDYDDDYAVLRGGRPRVYYSLTEKGRKELNANPNSK